MPFEDEREHGYAEETARARNQLDRFDRLYIPMTRIIKAVVLVICLSLCALGAIFSPAEHAEDTASKPQFVPVRNAQPARGIWLRV